MHCIRVCTGIPQCSPAQSVCLDATGLVPMQVENAEGSTMPCALRQSAAVQGETVAERRPTAMQPVNLNGPSHAVSRQSAKMSATPRIFVLTSIQQPRACQTVYIPAPEKHMVVPACQNVFQASLALSTQPATMANGLFAASALRQGHLFAPSTTSAQGTSPTPACSEFGRVLVALPLPFRTGPPWTVGGKSRHRQMSSVSLKHTPNSWRLRKTWPAALGITTKARGLLAHVLVTAARRVLMAPQRPARSAWPTG